jgi:AraC-like DNA-binding protein
MNWLRKVNPRVRTAGRGAWGLNFTEPPRRLYDHELVVFERGRCLAGLEGEKLEFKPNQWIVIRPGVLHLSAALSGDVIRRWVHFDWTDGEDCDRTPFCEYHPAEPDPRLLRPAPGFVPPGILRGSFSAKESPVIYALLDSVEMRVRHSSALERLTAKALFLEIIFRLFAGWTEGALPAPSFSPSVLKVRTLLDQMPPSSMSVQALVASAGQSYGHLCRAFKKECGLTPVEYLNKLRIETAARLLENSSLNISEIAGKCGCPNPAYFSALFKRLRGVSPRTLRRRFGASAGEAD